MHFHDLVLRYLYTMADGIVIYAKARAFKTKAGQFQDQEMWPLGQGLTSLLKSAYSIECTC